MSGAPRVRIRVPAEVAEAVLGAAPRTFGTGSTEVMLAALARAVRGYQRGAGIPDDRPVSVQVERHGRDDAVLADRDGRADLTRTVGWFTTIAPVLLDPARDAVHAVKAAKEELAGQPEAGAGFGLLRYGADSELAHRPLPSIGFNFFGAAPAVREPAADTDHPDDLLPAADAPELPSSVSGRMRPPNALTVNVHTSGWSGERELIADFGYDATVLDGRAAADLGARWVAELADIAAAASAGGIGWSPSDIPGAEVTQDDLDALARDYPAAAVWSLAPLQRGFYFQHELAADDNAVDVYATQSIIHFDGRIDVERLTDAVADLFAHHRVLRCGYVRAPSGAVVAVVPDAVTAPIPVVDASAPGALTAVAAAARVRPFDLAAPPAMAFILARGAAHDSLVVTNHHILFDGWSGPLVLADLLAYYGTGRPAGASTDGDYATYLAHIAATDRDESLAAWRSVLERLDGPTLVGTGAPVTADGLPRQHRVALGHDLTADLAAVSRDRQVTVSTILQAAWAILLSRLTGNRTVCFGETVSGRPAELDGVATMIGLFINTLPVAVDVGADRTVADLLDGMQRDKVAVLDHQHVSLAEIAGAVGEPALFDTLTLHESYPIDADSLEQAEAAGGGPAVAGIDMIDMSHYPLNLYTAPVGGRDATVPADIEVSLKYLPGEFTAAQVRVLAEVYRQILTAIVDDPAQPLGTIDPGSPDLRAAAVAAAVGPVVNLVPVTLADRLAVQVARSPEATALRLGGRSVTYGEFGARVNSLARDLIGAGVGPEDPVAVCLPRSVEMLVALHAVVAAGGQYLPIDTDAPPERAQHMLDTAGARLVLVLDRAIAALRGASVHPIIVDAQTPVDPTAARPVTDADRRAPLRPGHAAYTLFTSGSTGRPKGVTLTHAAVVNRLMWGEHEFGWGADDVVVQKTPYTFDCSVPELFGPLGVGAQLVIAEPGGHADPSYLADLVAGTGATSIHFVPSMLAVFNDVVSGVPGLRAGLSSLRWIYTTGEALPPSVAARTRELVPSARFYNLYGPTEAAVEITYEPITEVGDRVGIGVPVWNSSAYVLDEQLRPVPPGIPGELYLGGVQLARGYAARPDLTAGSFVADPFGDSGSRLYRTGDLVRLLPGDDASPAHLEYLGRTDFQVKLRGQRIELGEIESAIAAVPGVVHAAATVVSARGGERTGSVAGGAEHLVGYYAPAGVDLAVIEAALARTLPGYMRPTGWVPLREVVLNSAGKLDRNALPVPQFAGDQTGHRAPANTAEAAIAGVFADLLAVGEVSADADFFGLGGNSLTATRLAGRLTALTGSRVGVRVVFENATPAALARALGHDWDAGTEPVARPRPAELPLSLAQQRMWFLNTFDARTTAYNLPMALRVTGDVDDAAMSAAVRDVLDRHEVLRTRYPRTADGSGARQEIIEPAAAAAEVRFERRVVDDVAGAVDRFLGRVFDVTEEIPLQIALFSAADGEGDDSAGRPEQVLAAVVHHIAADGVSLRLLGADLMTAYAARAGGAAPDWAPLPRQFADVALMQRERLGSLDDRNSVLAKQFEFWRAELAGLPEVIEVPGDRARPPVATKAGATVGFSIPAEVVAGVHDLARATGTTDFMVVHTALAALIARLTATGDIVIGTPVAGRGDPETAGIIGMFVNTLVLRTPIDLAVDGASLVRAVGSVDAAAFDNADVPFEYLVEALAPTRTEAHTPLFQIQLAFQNFADPASTGQAGPTGAELSFEPMAAPLTATQTDLRFVLAPDGAGGWVGQLPYATDLYDEATARRLAGRFATLLAGIVTHPDRPVGDVELLGADERRAVSRWSRGPARPVPTELLPDLLFGRAAQTPHDPALVVDDRVVGYGELAARVAELARTLIAAGIGPDDAVAVSIGRSVDLVVAVYAAVAAGGQYVPIDTEAPRDRVDYVLRTAAARVLVVRPEDGESMVAVAARRIGARVVHVDTGAAVDPAAPPITDAQRRAPLRPGHAIYTLFTSGSTGLPKGVTVSHRAALNRLWWAVDEFGLSARDVFLQKTPYTFDVSVHELFGSLVAGARLVVARPGAHGDARYLADVIARERVTVVHFVPSMLFAFVDAVGSAALAPLRVLLVGGEALPRSTADEVAGSFAGQVTNLYGPTETTVDITSHRVIAGAAAVPIGTPVWNSAALVLDGRLRPVPPGVAGELYLGGVQLARGYAARSALTAERFVANPYGEPGERMYRTGDLVRWNGTSTPGGPEHGTGELEYLGRTDFQVQLRGQRIELGEIESAMVAVPGVVHAAAAVVAGPAGNDHLVGYVSSAGGPQIDVAAAKSALAQSLPSYMVPTIWVQLDRVELTTTGKLDRTALPVPDFGSVATEFAPPATPTETVLAGVFADTLGIDGVGVADSFFDLGGSSLSATKLAARAADALGVEVGVRDVFEAPTVRELAARLGAGTPAALPPILAVAVRPAAIPLTNAQRRMWFINRFDPALPTYNIPVALRIAGGLDADALRLAVADVLARHEVLRTLFPEHDGVPYQLVLPPEAALDLLDWAVIADRSAGDLAGLAAAAQTGFDLVDELPIRGRLQRVGAAEHLLLVVSHHIAGDGHSGRVLARDLVTAYSARVRGAAPAWAPLPVQVADVALWEERVLGSTADPGSVLGAELEFWRTTLTAAPSLLELPTDFPRPAAASLRGATVDFTIPAPTAAAITALAREKRVTPFMVVHTALAALLSRLAATSDVVIATPTAGRGRPEVDDLIGMFVNTLVLRTGVDDAATLADLLDRVRDVDLAAFAHARLPFEYLVAELAPIRSEAFAPLAQVLLTVEDDPGGPSETNGPGGPIGTDGLTIAPVELGAEPARVDLTIGVGTAAADQPWSGRIAYATELFTADTVRAFAGRLVAVLEALTAAPDTVIGAVDLLDDHERAELVPRSGGPAEPPVLLAEMFAAAAAAAPDALAVVDATGAELTYRELDERSNRLARWLIGRGVGAEQLVALLIPRSVAGYVAVWAVAKTGAGYVAVDPDYPAQRVVDMLVDSDATLALTVDGVELPEQAVGVESIGDAGLRADIAEQSAEPITAAALVAPVGTDNTAYVVYTSGSTGRPKGVVVSHRGLANYALAQHRALGVEPGARILGFASPSFDASVLEYLLAVTARGTLAYRPADATGGDELAQWMTGQRVEHGFLTPSVLATLDPSTLPHLKALMAGGEAVPATLVDRWSAHTRLHDLYGPTETTIGVTLSAPLRAHGGPVLLGGPIPGIDLLVVDHRLQPTPFGVSGELYLAGAGVSRGYHDRPGLTAQRFVARPGAAGARMYRTGDVVRWVRDRQGTPRLEYLGRSDGQVKLRGLRIELGEIQNALEAFPTVGAAAVVAVGRPTVTALAAYLVPAAGAGAGIDVDALRDHIARRLPAYLVPASIMVLDRLPMTPVGKLDTVALPEPVLRGDDEFVEPQTAAQRSIAQIYADLLGAERVGATDSFFDLGGNSLSATRLVARVGQALGVALGVRDVFEEPTVRGLAARAGQTGAVALPPITRVEPRPELLPLSFAQQRMWFLNQFEPASPAYNIPAVLRVTGTVDLTALRAAVGDVVVRHEVLRTGYPAVDGSPVAVVTPAAAAAAGLDWRVVDSIAEIEASVTHGFDVTVDKPLRVRVWPVHDGAIVAIVLHHIAADGESLRPLVGDLVTAYTARAAGTEPDFVPLPVQFADFAVWQHRELGAADDAHSVLAGQLAYWTEQLAGLPDVLELPGDRPRPPVASHRGARISAVIPAEVVAKIEQAARRRGVTEFMVFHAALAVLLARLSATEDIVVGASSAGRGQAVLDPLVGMFVNTLVLRTRIDPAASFGELLDQVSETDLAAFAHADIGFETLVEALNPVRSEAFAPLAQILLFFNRLSDVGDRIELPGLAIAPLPAPTVTARVDLTVEVSTGGPGQPWTVALQYATDLFEAATMELFVARLGTVLDRATGDPDRPVGDLAFLDPGELGQIERAESGASRDVPRAELVGTAVVDQVAATPGAIALRYQDRDVSYGEFGARVALLARRLIAAGVGPDTAVALAIPRSIDMVVAIHAIITAGGQYVPVDTAATDERVDYMFATASVALLVTAGSAGGQTTVTAVARQRGVPVIDFSADEPIDGPVRAVAAAERRGTVRPDHAVYTLFTSGSTGRPKGVTLSHRAVLNRLRWGLSALPIDQTDTVVLKTPGTFDVSVPELVAPLMVGARMVVLEPGTQGNPRELIEVIEQTGATMIHFVPSMLSAFLDVVGDRIGALESVRIMSFTGEALPPASASAVRRQLPGAVLYNLYGPTEAAVEITAQQIVDVDESATSVPIGTPIWNSSAMVLDSRLHRVPDGVAGELYVGGVQLARGYSARPDLTAERFIANPYGAPGSRLYRTGDVVRRRGDNRLEYLGRTDFQVKLRGQRVELGEIEAVMGRAPGIVHTVATVHETANGDQHLVGYYSPASVPADLIAQTLRAVLPGYMVPAVWMGLDEVVLNTAGKIDRKALPEPEFAVAALVEPTSPIEEIISGVMAEVLGVDRVGITDSFFEIGGNSLSATRVAARAAQALGADLTVRDVFEAPTVRELAARAGGVVSRAPLVAGSRPEHLPLGYAQQRMWFLNQFDPSSPAYNIPVALRITGELDADALRLALGDVIDRHEVLRTVYPTRAGRPGQQMVDAGAARDQLDWATVASSAQALAIGSHGFDVTVDLPIRARIAADGDGHTLVIVVHHIAADAESMPIFTRDLLLAYAARAGGEPPDWSPLPVQYADYALWQRAQLGDPDDETSILAEQSRYWAAQLAELPAITELPADRRRPAVADLTGGSLRFEFGPERSAAVHRAARGAGATPFMVVHTALAATVARLASTDDVAIGAAVAGRGQAAADELIGMFVNTVVLRTRHRGAATARQLLDQVAVVALAAFTHADIPFEQVVEAVAPIRSTAHAPLFQVGINYLVAEPGPPPGPPPGRPTVEILDEAPRIAKVDLHAAFTEVPVADGRLLHGELTYATALFDESTVAGFAEVFLAILDAITGDPQCVVADVGLLDDADRAELVPVVGDPVPLARATVREILARRTLDPAGIAVVEGSRELDHAEFESLTNRLARELIARGAGPEIVVGVGLRRSWEAAAVITAILKAGAAYLPLDPALPPDRLAHLVADADPALIVTQPAHQDAFGGAHQDAFGGAHQAAFGGADPRRLTTVAELTARALAGHDDRPVADSELSGRLRVDSLAYLVYTSGSTGRPKAVAVSQSGLARLHQQHREWTRDLPGTRILAVAAIGFDGAFFELFAAVGLGRTLVVAPADVYAGEALVDVIAEHRVTDAVITPAVLATMDPARAKSLRHLGTAGESVAAEVVSRWAPGRELFNGYGPTETTVSATGAILTAGGAITIGRPVAGLAAVVLDHRLQPVRRGVVGELYLAGDKVARGYHGQHGLTAARFVAYPFGSPGERMYRTGDLVRWTGSGAAVGLDFVGRADHQVKINGQRVELGEIDAALADQPAVAAAVTIGVADGSGRDRLVGYLVAADGATIDTGVVLDALRRRLPAYMVPAALVTVDDLPRTIIGKLDRRRLPVPDFDGEAAFEAPANATELLVADVFAEVLERSRISAGQNFFDAGGNSLSATRVIGLLREKTGADIALSVLFADPTPRGLAAALGGSASIANGVMITLRAGGGQPPLFCIHPAGGLAWFYGGLAPYVDDRPIYGLQDPHVVLDEPAAASVDELARRYAAEIRAASPRGPYHLLGWSIGGYLAHAVAVELQRAGESVGYLGIMDSVAGGGESGADGEPGAVGATPVEVGDLLGGWRELFDLPDDVTAASAEEVAAVVRDQIASMGLLEAGQVDRVMDSFANAAEIGAAYRPQEFTGDLHVFTAAADKQNPAAVAASWRPYITGTIVNVDVDTHHLGLADADSLPVVGPALQRGLAAAAAGPDVAANADR